MSKKYFLIFSLFFLIGCEVQESKNIYKPPQELESFKNVFELNIYTNDQINQIKIKLKKLIQKDVINLKEPISISFDIEDIPDYIDCGYMNEEIYVNYIERIFGTQLKADIGINLKMINDGILFEKFNIKYTFTSKETGTRWRFAANKPKDLLVGNPVYDGNPYRKCLSKNTLENEIIKYFSLKIFFHYFFSFELIQ